MLLSKGVTNGIDGIERGKKKDECRVWDVKIKETRDRDTRKNEKKKGEGGVG